MTVIQLLSLVIIGIICFTIVVAVVAIGVFTYAELFLLDVESEGYVDEKEE